MWLVDVAQWIIISPTILLHSQCLPVPSHPHPSISTLMIFIYQDTCSHQSHKWWVYTSDQQEILIFNKFRMDLRALE